jgi:molybdenum cofactor biosynthesis enzyme MoaA
MTKENFCSLPWIGLDISAQGHYRPCCKYDGIVAESYHDYTSSQELAELKQQFINGQRPKQCNRCWRDEDLGIQSKRQLDQKYVLNNCNINLENSKFLTIGFALGNTCNLACRICGSHTSSRWLPEAEKMQSKLPSIPIFEHKKFYKDQEFLDQLSVFADTVIHVDIYGGEPFLTGLKEHKEFLTQLLPRANEISIHYTTNCTIFPDEEFWLLWNNFKNVNIQLSIDGTDNDFEYSRWPASWNECYVNIKKYQFKQQDLSNLQLSVSTVVSIFTINNLDEFIQWCETEGLPYPYLGIISKPEYYDITVLPQEVKKEIASRLNLPAIVDHMFSIDNSHLLPITKKYIDVLDQHRNQQSLLKDLL